MAGGYPWSVLGIDPTDDIAAIRRAYARRLRAARPDENPDAFQDLVQARDAALKLASQPRRPRGISTVSFELERPGATVTTINVSFEEPPPPEIVSEAAPRPPASREEGASQETPAPDDRPPPASPSKPKLQPAAGFQPEPQPGSQPRGSRAPALRRQAPPPAASPHGVIEAAKDVFGNSTLYGWSDLVRRLGELSQSGRVAVERPILRLAARYARENRNNLAKMRGASQTFFALLAALNSEFGWRERDRIVYSTLDDAVEADAFVALLDRAHRQPRRQPELLGWQEFSGLDSDGDGLTPNQRRDRYHFFDQNNDAQGLSICRKLLADPDFRRKRDAFGLLFVPAWPRKLGEAPLLLFAVLGWITLWLALVPGGYWILPIPVTYLLLRDVHFSEPPRSKVWAFVHKAAWAAVQAVYAVWIAAASLAWLQAVPPEWLLWMYAAPPVVFGYCAYAAARLLIGATGKRREEHPGWDRRALFFFPIIAAARGYYARFAVGLAAWLALLVHGALPSISFFWTGKGNFGHLVLLLLVIALHINAGYNSGRWLLLRFFSVVRTADRRQMFDPELRAAFLLEKGTRKTNQHQKQQGGGSRTSWWWIVLFLWLLGHLMKALSHK
jgi:hypothetical protein